MRHRIPQITLVASVVLMLAMSIDSHGSDAADLRDRARQFQRYRFLAATCSCFAYRYVQSPYKPYADRLVSPAGTQILRDSPSDHKHHHGLMFALSADGVNFWEEDSPDAGPASSQANSRRKGDRRRRLDSCGLHTGA